MATNRYEAGKGKAEDLSIAGLVIDARLQCRAEGLSEDHLEIIQDAIKGKAQLPRILTFNIKGMGILPVEGFHRIESRKRLGLKTIPAYVRNGTWEDAVLAAAGANREHNALIRTRADKHNAARLVLQTPLYVKDSDRKIADRIGVSHTLVAEVRAELESAGRIEETPIREGKDGKTRKAPKLATLPVDTGGEESKESTQPDNGKQRKPKSSDPLAPVQGAPVYDWDRANTGFSECVKQLDGLKSHFPSHMASIRKKRTFVCAAGEAIGSALNDLLNEFRHEWEQAHAAIRDSKS